MSGVPGRLAVKRAKVVEYLLNPGHAEGGPKARFFLSLGFSLNDPEPFIAELFRHAEAASLMRTEQGMWGTKDIFEGALRAPGGRNPSIHSVWHRAPGSEDAVLVTAYPI